MNLKNHKLKTTSHYEFTIKLKSKLQSMVYNVKQN